MKPLTLATLAAILSLPVVFLQAQSPAEKLEKPTKIEEPARPKVSWLGLAARSVEPVESTQLDLPKGFGLVVEYVFPDSPASKAGVLSHDILRKFDDQLLINPAQLKTLVGSKSKGDPVKLTLLRSGEEIEVELLLAERQIPAVAFRMVTPPDGGDPYPVPANSTREVPVGNLKDLLAGRGIGIRGVHVKSLDFGNCAASLIDTTGTYTLTRDGKSATLRATKGTETLFEGEVTTEAHRAALPPEIRQKLESLESVMNRAKTEVESESRSNEVKGSPPE